MGLGAAAFADTHIVPDECPTIAAGIERADPGDTVLVRKGFYRETLIIQKPITLRGEGADTILTTEKPSDRNVILVFAPSGPLAIEELTVTGGECGISVLRTLDDPVTLKNLRVTDNEAGVEVFGGTITEIIDSCFVGNDCGVLFWRDASATIARTEIWLGQIGISIADSSSVVLSFNLIVSQVPIYVYGPFDECSLFRPRESFSGTVEGSGNKLLGTQHDLLPSLDAPVWPGDFAASGFHAAALSCIGAFSDASKAHSIGALHTAEATYKSALMAAKSLGMTLVVADAGFTLGRLHYDSQEYQDAAVWLETSLESHLHLGLIEETAEVRRLLASTYSLGSYRQRDAAIPLLESAFFTYTELGNVQARAACLSSLLSACNTGAEPRASMPSLTRILDACEEMNDTQGEADTLAAMAHVSYWSENYTDSITFGLRAFDRYAELRDQHGMADVLQHMAFAHNVLGNVDKMLDLYDQVLDLYRALDDGAEVASTLWGKGKALMELDRFEEALPHLMESVDVYSSIEDRARTLAPEGEAWAVMDLADCQLALERYAQAESTYEAALELGRLAGQGVLNFTIRPYWGIGKCHWAMDDLEEALQDYEAAVAEAEAWIATEEEEAFRQSMYEISLRRLYEEYIELLFEVGDTAAMLPASERCRARTFLDLLATGPMGHPDSIMEAGIQSQAVDTEALLADLGTVIAELPPQTAVLEYFVAEAMTYLWLIRDGEASDPIEIEIAEFNLRDHVLKYRAAIETSSTGLSDAPDEEILTLSRNLYELLIAPIEDQLEGIEHLVIVPSGSLYYVPFCALMSCPDCAGPDLLGGESLIERFSLSYTPSLTALKYTWASTDEVGDDPLFLALADPDSGDAEIPRLPAAQDEADAVGKMFDPSEVYVDTSATEDVVIERASSADQILLSTHAWFDPVNPMLSYLLMTPTEDHDGRLHTYEVFSLDLHADLVTLSACETLLPALKAAEDRERAIRGIAEDEPAQLPEEVLDELTAGDEIVGLTRAFLAAGTPSVLSSLWRVVSETTEPLMVAFYGYLANGLDKVDALQRAQRDVMASYPHPRYWAAFSLMGDWRSACDLACQTKGKVSFSLLEAIEESMKEGSAVQAPMVSVLVTLREGISEVTTQAIASVSDAIRFEGGFGRFVQLTIPLAELVALSRLSEVEQITVPPAMSTTP